MNITFDESEHAYTVNGRRVPSVTQVLGDIISQYRFLADAEYYMQRGTAVHAAAAMIATGQTPVIEDTDPANREYMEGCIEAVRRFMRELNPAVRDVERRVGSARHMYAGTLDLVATIGGQLAIFDWKASLTPATPYQLAAYSLALAETSGLRPIVNGYGVELHPDGTYQMSERYDLRKYTNGWLAMLTTYGIRARCL